MPAERRSLRSNSKADPSSSANGEKTRSGSQSSSSKDKATPTTRSAANKAKAAPAKKGAKSNANSEMSGNEQPHANGSERVENGVNGSEDVVMEEDTAVPPSKGSRLSGQPGQDKEEDVAMEGAEEEEAKEPEVDPYEKTVQGRPARILCDT